MDQFDFSLEMLAKTTDNTTYQIIYVAQYLVDKNESI